MIEQHRQTYREEAGELLTELESSLLALDETPSDPDLIGRVFRAMHTIKGSGAMFGFDAIAAFTHEVETVFDLVRKGEVRVTTELVNVTLAARDRIRAMLDEDESDPAAGEEIIRRLKAVVASSTGAPLPAAGEADLGTSEGDRAGEECTYRIRFKPPRDIMKRGGDALGLMDELRDLGDCHAVVNTGDVPALEEMDPEDCYLCWDAILTTKVGQGAIRDVFMFFEGDGCELSVTLIDDGSRDDVEYKRVGEILVERGDVTAEQVERALSRQKKISHYLLEEGAVQQPQIAAALVEQKVVREQRARRQAAAEASSTSIRVAAEKLDGLVNLVGELVTVQARFSALAGARADAELLAVSEEVERLTWALRDSAMNVRMLPIGTIFGKFKRLVHDLSAELGKQIDLVTEGAETELDKNVIEKLGDPLVHLIRNAADHGIEPPERRAAAGKLATGRIRLAAEHSGANVLIRIEDDGAGLDREAIRAKATERGLLAPGAEPSDKELFGLILLPGFSTARAVTSVSGRGVGMDVVKQAIDSLQGSIEIQSERGRGTRMTIRLPLTLAIIDGLLVRIGAASYVLPLSVVQECVELTADKVGAERRRNITLVRGQLVPYVRLREQFGVDDAAPPREQVVITEIDGARVGFVVDHVVGEHQTVIKSLGPVYRGIPGLSGSTILGDGSVALILDVPKLFQQAETIERAAWA